MTCACDVTYHVDWSEDEVAEIRHDILRKTASIGHVSEEEKLMRCGEHMSSRNMLTRYRHDISRGGGGWVVVMITKLG